MRVCAACLRAAEPPGGTLCTRCGEALGFESARFAQSARAMGAPDASHCTVCRLAPPAFERAVAAATYDDRTRALLRDLKFGGERGLARYVLGKRLASAVLQLQEEAGADVLVVPVPLFGAREKQRGFNQAELLARAAVKALARSAPGWKLTVAPRALERIRDTRALFALGPHERRSRLRGAFAVRDAEAVRGREVLLIDDILTTGATARECARTLRAAGAAKVWVATVARAQLETVATGAARTAAVSGVAFWDAAPIGAKQGSRGVQGL